MLVKGKSLEEIKAKCVFFRVISPNGSPLMVRVCSPDDQFEKGSAAGFVSHV